MTPTVSTTVDCAASPAGCTYPCQPLRLSRALACVWLCAGASLALANQGGDVSTQTPETSAARASAPETAAAEKTMPSTAPRLVLSADGKEVIDTRAKLAWRRCVEGMIWFGATCTGRAKTFTMAEAQAHVASENKATGQRWRLPHIPELKVLTDKATAGRGALVDTALFPATPASWHWSASVSVGIGGNVNQYNYGNIMSGVTPSNANQLKALEGWGLNFATGEASGGISKRDALFVRLVRPNF